MGRTLLLVVLASIGTPLWCGASNAGEIRGVEAAERLAAVLRAGRSVISGHQDLINDPAEAGMYPGGDKGLDGDRIVDETIALYRSRIGAPPFTDDMPESERRLVRAQIESMREIVDEHQDEINAVGVGFKGFIPATFGRLVNERFAEKVGDEAQVKVTAPADLVRNRKSRPDEWEREVIESRFLDPDWSKGEPFTEDAQTAGRPAFRMLLPEYYSESCLACHGGPAGDIDVTGYPKEGGSEGELAGAISITVFK